MRHVNVGCGGNVAFTQRGNDTSWLGRTQHFVDGHPLPIYIGPPHPPSPTQFLPRPSSSSSAIIRPIRCPVFSCFVPRLFSSRRPQRSHTGRTHPIFRRREPSRRRPWKRILHLGALCSPPLDPSVRNFSFSHMHDAPVLAQHHPSVIAVIGDVRSHTVSYAAPFFFQKPSS